MVPQGAQTNREGERGRETTADCHFEERVGVAPGDIDTIYWVGLTMLVPVLAISLWIGYRDYSPLYAVVGVGGTVALLWSLYATFRQTVHVTVDETAVDIDLEGYRLRGSSGSTIAMAAIERVQYNDPDGPYLYVLEADRDGGTERYRIDGDDGSKTMTTYANGVRIERTDGPPVYVGSDRHVELAETIAALAPAVTEAEQLSVPNPYV